MSTPEPSTANTVDLSEVSTAIGVVASQVTALAKDVGQLRQLLTALVSALDTPNFRSMVDSHLATLSSLQRAVKHTAGRVESLSEHYIADSGSDESLMDVVGPFLGMPPASGPKRGKRSAG